MLMYRANHFTPRMPSLKLPAQYLRYRFILALYSNPGWYTNTTLQLARYSGQVESNNSTRKPDIRGRGQILAF